MTDLFVIDRKTKTLEKEKVYGKAFIEALYGKSFFSKILSFIFLRLIAKGSFLFWLYGLLQRSSLSSYKIKPFIHFYGVDESEFENTASFPSFNAFFIRKLKPSCRPIAPGENIAIMPADGRVLVFEDISKEEGFFVKGKKLSLEALLQDNMLAKKYAKGSLFIARLCPTDYHRFHFPVDCLPQKPLLIPGPLYSVNPLALAKNIGILSENKRVITSLQTRGYGNLLFIEVGATFVGTIHQTYQEGIWHKKGEEKGYFSFGGSCLLLLFEPQSIQFDEDLLVNSKKKIETKVLFGQSMGKLQVL